MVLYHRIEWRSGGPAWSVDVPGTGPVGCSVRVVSVSRESLHRGRHGGACLRTRGAAMGGRATTPRGDPSDRQSAVAAAMNSLSDVSLVAPYRFTGAAALSVLSAMTFCTVEPMRASARAAQGASNSHVRHQRNDRWGQGGLVGFPTNTPRHQPLGAVGS